MNTVTVDRDLCPSFDPAFRGCEDIEWGIRLQERTREVAVIESADSFFRQHAGLRHGNARRVRLDSSKKLLELHASHYGAHPHQKAYRFFRIGYMHFQEQELREALYYAGRSLIVRPHRRALALIKDTLAAYLSAARDTVQLSRRSLSR